MKADPFPHKHTYRAAYLERLVPAQTPDKMRQAPVRQNDASWTGAENYACGSVVNRSDDDVVHMGSLGEKWLFQEDLAMGKFCLRFP